MLLLHKHDMKKMQQPAGRATGIFNAKSMGDAGEWLRTARHYAHTPKSYKTHILSTKKLLRNKEYRLVAREFISKGVKVAIKGRGDGVSGEQAADNLQCVMSYFWTCKPVIDGPFRGNVFYKDSCGNYCER